ncbi:zinc-dependent peptidase [Myxococcota bacterium]|nr:zinc-dependent peptidase [Myxococcota bacterium]
MTILLIMGILTSIFLTLYFTFYLPQRILDRKRRERKAERKAEQEKLLEKGFPREWKEYLFNNWAIYRHLPLATREQLHKKAIEFFTQKDFLGKRGFRITDEVKLLISAQASLLVMNQRTCYPRLHKILVYPESMATNVAGNSAMSAYLEGTISLAWDAAAYGARLRSDSYNVVIHECAHQLDQTDLKNDGIPALPNHLKTAGWAATLKKEFQTFSDTPNDRQIIQEYGKTDMAEYFACATEAFFERPEHLHRVYPTLYNLLKDFYELDPAILYNQKKE